MHRTRWLLTTPFTAISLAIVISFVSVTAVTAAEPNTLTAEELNAGWILLFDGETEFGWRSTSDANWKVVDGALTASEGDQGLLVTTSEFADYELRLDFKAPAGTNSGVFLRTPERPTDPSRDCYELNIADPETSPFYTGSFVGRQKPSSEYQAADGWQTFEVTARGGHFTVKLDGREVLDYTDSQPVRRGRIGLQFNKGPIAFRNVKLKPLSLESIFNGRDLTGWTVFPDRKSVFSVTAEGELNVKNGNGQLESEGQWGDFVLQLEIFSNGKFLNSGIFFRSIPGEFWQGYESQIQNGYLLDRSKPMDCGTGGFYRRQNARKVVANDFEWFHKTLVVSGNHMAAWVNGYQVSDFTDERPPHENPRNGLRLKPGTLSIQGHDPTTDLSFRNLRIVEMPER